MRLRRELLVALLTVRVIVSSGVLATNHGKRGDTVASVVESVRSTKW